MSTKKANKKNPEQPIVTAQDWFNSKKFIKLRNSFVKEGEREFEKLVLDFPYRVVCNTPDKIDEIEPHLQERKSWLKKHMTLNSYQAFPENASVGKYKYEWRCVYFNNPKDAMLFKLRWA
jgi:hypothetical protein